MLIVRKRLAVDDLWLSYIVDGPLSALIGPNKAKEFMKRPKTRLAHHLAIPAALVGALGLSSCITVEDQRNRGNQANGQRYNSGGDLTADSGSGGVAPSGSSNGQTNYAFESDDQIQGLNQGQDQNGVDDGASNEGDGAANGSNDSPDKITSSGPPDPSGDHPRGIPVPTMPGHVYSPYSRDEGIVDVREWPSGTLVKDPFKKDQDLWFFVP